MSSFPEFAHAIARRCAPVFVLAALLLPMLGVAQQPEPLALPDLKLWTNGSVNAIAEGADGTVVFGGNFSEVNGVPRRNLARLRADRTLDPDFNPGTNSSVNAIAVDANGNIFVGGFFTEIAGQARDRIAKLDANAFGTLDPNWNPGANDSVDALAIQGSSGALFAGGTFTMMAGVSRGRLAKVALAGNGVPDLSWDPNVGGSVIALAYDAGADFLYVAGNFNVIGSIPRAFIAKVAGSVVGAVDESWDPGADEVVTSLQLDGASKLYAGGKFTTFASQPHARIARVDTLTAVADPTFVPVIAGGDVFSLALYADRIYVAGSFTEIDGTPRIALARLATLDGALDPNFAPVINAAVNVIETFDGSTVYVGGSQFTDLNGAARLGFAALNASGVALAALDVMSPGAVLAFARLNDGSMLVGGDFSFVGIVPRRNLFKLTALGLLDPDFSAGTDGPVRALQLDTTAANVYATGTFLNANAVLRPSIAKFATAAPGTLDLAFNPASAGGVRTVAVASDGSVYVGGSFAEIAGNLRNRVAKLSGTTGALFPTWGGATGADDTVNKLVVAPDGSVFASGFFNVINGGARMGLAKLDAVSGNADPNWVANLDANRFAPSMVFENGAMYLGGGFASVGGLARAGLAKVSIASPAVVDASWAPVADGEIESLALSGTNSIFVAGGFIAINGQVRDRAAKLSTLGSGALDPFWAPDIGGSYVSAVAIDANANVLIGGSFNRIGTQFRQSLAALPQIVPPPDAIFLDGFE